MTLDFTPFTINFASGLLGSNIYNTSGLDSVCRFLDMCMRQNSEPFLCSIFRSSSRDISPTVKDTDIILYFDGSNACLFFHPQNKDQILSIFNYDGIDLHTSELIGVIDDRWNIMYFLPAVAFVKPEIALEAVSEYCGGGALLLTDLSQEGDAVMAVYNKMVACGQCEE